MFKFGKVGGFEGRNGPQVIKEEDLENDAPDNNKVHNAENEDIYNSNPVINKKLSGRDFFGFFKLPLIIIVLLISAIIVLKYIFSGKPENAVKKVIKKNTVINDRKRFSPSIFDYGTKPAAKKNETGNMHLKERDGTGARDKFNVKFKKEADKLNRHIKFNSNGSASYGRYGRQTQASVPQITKKTVVFIEASYGKYILDSERKIKNSTEGKGGPVFKSGSDKNRVSGFPRVANNSYIDSDIALPQGTVIDAYTKYKIFSYNTSVPVIAIAASGYYFDGKAVFEKGEKFFGTVSVKHSLNRLNINFDKIIERSGKSLTIDAIAMMPDGSGGVEGDVHNHYAGNILTSIAQGIVGAASIFVGGGSGANSSEPYTFQDQVRQNVARNELNSAENGLNDYSQSNQNISITLPAGTPIKIIFLKPVYINSIEGRIR